MTLQSHLLSIWTALLLALAVGCGFSEEGASGEAPNAEADAPEDDDGGGDVDEDDDGGADEDDDGGGGDEDDDGGDPGDEDDDGGVGEQSNCDGEVVPDVVPGDLIIDVGETCELFGTHVEGDIEINPEATLLATNINVDGEVVSFASLQVSIGESQIEDSISVRRGGSIELTGSIVDGNVKIEEMSGLVVVNGNQIDGDLQANENEGGVQINENEIEDALVCNDNDPAPTGSGNDADSQSGQCEDL